jgi:hypothetical protein
LLLCVGYHLLAPFQNQLMTRLTLRAPALSHSPELVRVIERLEERLQALESRLLAREHELEDIMRELRRLSERDRWTHQLLDEVGDSILVLSEAVCPLNKRAAESTTQR